MTERKEARETQPELAVEQPLSDEAHEAIDEAMVWLSRDALCQCGRCRFIRRLCLALHELTGAELPGIH